MGCLESKRNLDPFFKPNSNQNFSIELGPWVDGDLVVGRVLGEYDGCLVVVGVDLVGGE